MVGKYRPMIDSNHSDSAEGFAYSGTDVLEIMAATRNYNAYLLGEVIRHAADTVVDFGAGTGTFATWMRDRGYDVVCIEPDERQRHLLDQKGFATFPGSAAVASEPVSYAYSVNVLEHVADDAEAARSLFRVLRPGGRCFLYVPAFQFLYSSFDRRVGHLRRYRKGPLTSMLRQTGFVVERAEYVDCLGFVAALAFKAAASKDGRLNPTAVQIFDRFVFPLSRWADRAAAGLFGKNIVMVVKKPRSGQAWPVQKMNGINRYGTFAENL